MKLNYEKPKRTPMQDLINAYNNADNVKEVTPSDSKEALRQKYNENPHSLNPTQLVELGMHELQEQRDKEAKAKQYSASDFMNAHVKDEKKRQEEISTQSEQFLDLSRNIAKLQKEWQALNGGVE